MCKLLIFALLCFVLNRSNAQDMFSEVPRNNDIILEYGRLSAHQLLDTAYYYFNRNSHDTASVCYNLIINATVMEDDTSRWSITREALNQMAVICYLACNYQMSYELLLKEQDLCEKYRFNQHKWKVYVNIGNIYGRFKKNDMAKLYYLKALEQCSDIDSIVVLNNLGAIELENESGECLLYLNRALQISEQHNNHAYLDAILNSMALYYQKTGQYDSAYHCFHHSLEISRKNNIPEAEAYNLMNLGRLFSETCKTDSAFTVINRSNTIAVENNFLGIMSENYLTLSRIKEAEGNKNDAFEYFKTYSRLKDSIFNNDKFGEINQLQRLHEIASTNRHIEDLALKHKISERTLRYQKIIRHITMGVSLLVCCVLLYIISRERRQNKSNKILFDKNVKIVELENNIVPKYKNSALASNAQQALLIKITNIMENTALICNPEFTMHKLSEMTNSNNSYVSKAINGTLHKNFRSLLNSYRISEAQRLLMELDMTKYTIESIVHQTGFKSKSTFNSAFKEITGVTPYFYLKEMREKGVLPVNTGGNEI